jgi:parallel beta-helix repeat protein
MIYLLLIAFSVILHVNSYAATYFVAKTGSNNNSCIQAQSETTPKLTIGSGISCLAAGDTLMIGPGSYSESISASSIPSGSSWSNTTKIKGAGMNNGTRLLFSGDAVGIHFTTVKQYIEFYDLELDGNNNSGHDGIKIDNVAAHHLRFTRIRAHHVRDQGILTNASAHDLEFFDIEAHHNGVNGSCYKAGGYCHGLYIDSDNVLVDGCSLHDNQGLGVQWYPSPNNVTMRNCVVYNNYSWGIFFNAATNVKIYNNTVYNNGTGNGHPGIAGSGSTNQIRNNIAYNNAGGQTSCGGGAVCSNNFTGDPNFVNAAVANFQLQSTSGAIDAGTNLGSSVPTDRNGVPRPQGSAFDIGAYEFVGSSPQLNAPSNLQVTAN